MKKLLFCLLSGILLMFSSCQSEEPTTGNTGGNTTTSNSNTVKFVSASPNVRTHYHTDGSVKWSHHDQIRISSPRHDGRSAHQHAHYTIGENGGDASGIFDHIRHDLMPDPIVWHEGEKQHFYGYYPAESVKSGRYEDGEFDLGAITHINTETGSAYIHVPADQSAMARVIPSAADHDPHPLAYAIAATTNVPVDEENSVQLEFHDIMNVLRIHVYNPTDQLVKGVKLNTTAVINPDDYPLYANPNYIAGTGQIAFIPTSHDAPSNQNAYVTTREEIYANYLPGTLTPLSNEITATNDEPSALPDLYYDLYLLPQYYDVRTLQITVLIGNDNNPNNDIVKTIPSSFDYSSIKKVRIDVPIPDRVYMGIVEGRDLYFATGNLIAEYSSVPSSGENAAPDSYYIAGTVPGKSKFIANSEYGSNAINGIIYTGLFNTERDLFKFGTINSPDYWVDNNISPRIGDYTLGMNYSGNESYDLVRYALGNNWRTPKAKEFYALTNTDYYIWTWHNDYQDNIGVNGFTVSTIPGTTPGVSADAPATSIFLPAVGLWQPEGNEPPTNAILGRGTTGYYWSSTHAAYAQDRFAFMLFSDRTTGAPIINTYTDGSGLFTLRPVSNDSPPVAVDFDNGGYGWMINKERDNPENAEEVL